MAENQEDNKSQDTFFSDWLNQATQMWGGFDKIWPDIMAGLINASGSKHQSGKRAHESIETVLKSWEKLSSAMSEPGGVEGVFKGFFALPEILLKVLQARWDGLYHVQEQWLERLGRITEKTTAFEFDDVDQSVFKTWTDIYEKEFRQFLNIPQLGLTRFYQEHFSRALDEYTLFQGALGEFLYLFYLPLEKSFMVMHEKISEMAEKGSLPENPKDYYNLWIKVLEGHYMTLFKSPEYTRALGKTLNAMETFMAARQEILHDMLKALPIPTHKEMDDLYKEIYLLKKRIRQLEKAVSNPESAGGMA